MSKARDFLDFLKDILNAMEEAECFILQTVWETVKIEIPRTKPSIQRVWRDLRAD